MEQPGQGDQENDLAKHSHQQAGSPSPGALKIYGIHHSQGGERETEGDDPKPDAADGEPGRSLL